MTNGIVDIIVRRADRGYDMHSTTRFFEWTETYVHQEGDLTVEFRIMPDPTPVHVCPAYTPPKIEEGKRTEMPEYIVSDKSETGRTIRQRLIVIVSIGGEQSTLSDAESEELAKIAAQKLGVTFVGRA